MRHFILPLFALILMQSCIGIARAQTPAAPTTYYLDCSQGSDTNSGTSAGLAWKSISKANQANLLPGDSLLLKAGCVWTANTSGKFFILKWNGTEAKPIIIGSYGVGNKPIIRSDAQSTSVNNLNVAITGTYLVVQDIKTDTINPHLDDTCLYTDGSSGRQGWYAGFTIGDIDNVGGNHGDFVTLRNVEVSNMSIGVNLGDESNNNKVLDSYFHNLNVFTRIYHPAEAYGSVAVHLHGTDNEAANNTMEANISDTQCTETALGPAPGTKHNYSAPFEIYNATRAVIHHNKAYGHRKHFEMGKDTTVTSADNTLAYNLFVSDQPDARGPNIHGNDSFGPVTNTRIYNNTIVLTGTNSQALIAGSTGFAGNNIFVAEGKAAFYNTAMTESNNIYWDYQKTSDAATDPCVQWTGSGCTSLNTIFAVNPLLVNPIANLSGNFRLTRFSPAINAGMTGLPQSIYLRDIDNQVVPQGSMYDIGSDEFISAGDANEDGLVDINDFLIWIQHYGETTILGAATFDFNNDTKINAYDFAVWKENL